MIDVGLIGYGFAGRIFHAPFISATEGLRLAAIVQRSGPGEIEQYPKARVVRSVEELLAIDSVRLVVIATPNASHFPLAKQCLLAGRDVVIDKPFTTSYAQARELVETAEKAGRIVTVYQNRRWDGDFLTLRGLISEGRLGRILQYESHFDRFRPQLRPIAWREKPEPGSGLLFDLGPHVIDQALLLFGTPEGVAGDVRTEREGGSVDDAFDIVLYYPQMKAILRASVMVTTATPRFAVQGTAGGYLKYGLDPQEDALKAGQRPIDKSWGRDPQERWGTLSNVTETGLSSHVYPTLPGDYRRYYENVRDAISHGTTPDVAPQQALNVMRAIELARQSSERRCVLTWS